MALMVFVTISFAQEGEIIHINLNNEKVKCTTFDFDGSDDKIFDLRFCCRKGDHQGPPIFEVSNAYYDTAMSPSHTNWTFHLRADINDTIALLDDWKATFSHIFAGAGALHEDFHTGIRQKLPDGNYCYGWISYRVDGGDDPFDLSGCWITLYEYAYCTIPEYPFCVGQTSFLSVDENQASAFATVHPNPTTGVVRIIGKDLKAAEVVNTLGQRVATVQGKGQMLQIDIANLPEGVYFVRITDEQGRKCVRKVVKE